MLAGTGSTMANDKAWFLFSMVWLVVLIAALIYIAFA
jgi:hypothetical protein